jgi:Uma2 family endonuclease
MSALPSTAWFEQAPDWVCEVLSPATALIDRTRKQEAYRTHGVPWLWFVDPTARTIEVLRNGDNGWLVTGTFGGATEARIPPFDAVSLDLSTLWELSPSTAP